MIHLQGKNRMEKIVGNKSKMRSVVIIMIAILIIVAIFLGIKIYQLKQISGKTFDDLLYYSTKDVENVVITVGIIRDGEMTYKVYGEDGKELDPVLHQYEIGSVTKTFTCSLLCKAISEGRLTLDDQISQYIKMPKGYYYPTIRKLVTHTSGYKGYYFDKQMIDNFIHRRQNDFYGISMDTLNMQVADHIVKDKQYPFQYSNFGISVVGSVISNIYKEDYETLMNQYITEDLNLYNTYISKGTGDLMGYWTWREDDAYLAAGAIISNVEDMMQYLNLHMTNQLPYLKMGHQEITNRSSNNKIYESMGIRIDSQGIGWMLDKQNNLIWHNGGTSNFNSYIAFDKDRQIGVVILSNISPDKRVPATVLGIKLIQELQDEYDVTDMSKRM